MTKDLKNRWKKVCADMKKSGLKKTHIAAELKTHSNTLSQYTAIDGSNPKYPSFVTESMTKKLEDYLLTKITTPAA